MSAELLSSSTGRSDSRDPGVRARVQNEAQTKTRHILVAIQRKALANREEKGIETLFLAMGMATWAATDGGRPYAAPVLLLSARIELRGRAGEEIRLVLAGEPQLNPVLLYVLDETFGVRVNAADALSACSAEDEDDHWRVDPECLFGYVKRVAVNILGFKTQPRAILANFQFAKMAMVEDLRRNGEAMARSTIVAAVAGHSSSRQRLAQSMLEFEPAMLDERPASDDFLVLDADSTQHRAIVLIGKGQNGVVQGPPGTGKSQTIANLIAQSVAGDWRVLFVAEKRAALDAVIKRLEHPDVGLGHLVLDLHGASVSRKEVMARLANTLDQIRGAVPADGVEAVHREFEARRRQLNEHARRINVVRLPTGLSVNQIVGRLLRLPAHAKSALRLRGATLTALTAERVEQVSRWILDGAANAALLLGTDASPWNNADIKDGHRAQEAIDLAARATGEGWPQFEERLSVVVRDLGVRPPTTFDEIEALLAVLRDMGRVRERYADGIFEAEPGTLAHALEAGAGSLFTRAWAFLTDSAFRSARKKLLSLRSGPATVATLFEESVFARDLLQRLRGLGAAAVAPANTDATTTLSSAFVTLSEATTALGEITGASFRGAPLTAVAERLRALAADQRTPYRLPGVYAIRASLSSEGLGPFLSDLRQHGVLSEHWTDRFEYVWLHSALEQVLAEDPGLASFKGQTHEQIVADFVRLDRERVRLAAGRVRRLHGERAIEAMNSHFDQANLVKAEAGKKSRHISLRELLISAPDVLTRIAPCWVASPLSVSQLLDGGKQQFDLVVFDEASQILQEEAIPSLYRAGQVVVAGDRHQLPPTTFFATVVEGEDDGQDGDQAEQEALATATEAIGGFESLLNTLEAFLPPWLLEWHYRSEDERLIAFSNQHIYSGRLVTFPSARNYEAIRHVLVPHDASLGTQEESASREVEEVVRLVLEHAETRPDESLGVIAMGIKHANRVQAALDRALYLRPDLSPFFSLEREERFFVKNLETVQGDERDAIILSVGYGKTASGDLPHRFGPLTQEAGHRRLNVAVTRAKRRITVVSSFSHNEIDLDRSGSRGVQLLKAYLEYAASGGARLPEAEHAGEVRLNPFEADIRDALEARNIRTRPQFGVSRYRIDLVAMHPEKPGRPVLAIECDGASYHSSATARDRDRLRQAHLMRLGWCFHRIWSTDWFYNREQELDRAVVAVEDAVRRADLIDEDENRTRLGSQLASPPGPGPTPEGSGAELPQRGPRPPIPVRENIDQYSERELRQLAEWITSDRQLRTDEELIREVFEELPFQRMGGRIRTRLEALVSRGRERRDVL